MSVYNVVMFLIVAVSITVTIFYFMKPDPLADLAVEVETDPYCLDSLITTVKETLGEYDKLNVAELNMNKAQSEKIESSKKKLAAAKKTCCYGDKDAKRYVKEIIKKILTENVGVDAVNVCRAIPFNNYSRLTTIEKFDVLLYVYRKQFAEQAMTKLIQVNNFDQPFGEGSDMVYKITAPQIEQCFMKHVYIVDKLNFEDYLEMVTQRVYASYLGLGIFDELVEMDIDGVRGGTSGINESIVKVFGKIFSSEHGDLDVTSYNAVWIIYKGTEMHLSFLGCGTQKEFVRIASRIYKYDNPGTLDASSGGIISKMMDGSRVVVTRPPAAESWAFFVRKLDVGSKMSLEQLMPDKGNQKLFKVVKAIVSGDQNLALTGEQRTGKSTFMMSIIQFIKASYTIRILEKESELNLRKIYPERDIQSFKDIPTFNGQKLLDIQKKTDGSVNLIGEVADYEQGAWAIQTGETGSNQVMFTGHMKTVPLLIAYFRTAMLVTTPGANAKQEEELCARVLNFNIHLSKTLEGHRFVERVSMIIPHVLEDYPNDIEGAQKEYYRRQTDRPTFDWVDIVRWVDGEYKYTGEFTEEVAADIATKLAESERSWFKELCEEMRMEVRGSRGEVA